MLTKEEIIAEGWKLETPTSFVRPETTILEDGYYIEMIYTLDERWNCTIYEVDNLHDRTQLFYGTINDVESLRTLMNLLDLDLPNRDPNRVHVSWREVADELTSLS